MTIQRFIIYFSRFHSSIMTVVKMEGAGLKVPRHQDLQAVNPKVAVPVALTESRPSTPSVL